MLFFIVLFLPALFNLPRVVIHTMLPAQYGMFSFDFYKCKKFSLTFCLIYVCLFVTEFQNEKLLELEGTLERNYLVKLTIDKTQDSKKFSDLPKDIH